MYFWVWKQEWWIWSCCCWSNSSSSSSSACSSLQRTLGPFRLVCATAEAECSFVLQ
jgi:hypothetical protein